MLFEETAQPRGCHAGLELLCRGAREAVIVRLLLELAGDRSSDRGGRAVELGRGG